MTCCKINEKQVRSKSARLYWAWSHGYLAIQSIMILSELESNKVTFVLKNQPDDFYLHTGNKTA